PGDAEFGDLFEEIVMDVEEKGEPAGEVVHLETRFQRRLDVSDTVTEGKGQFLRGGRTGLADVVAGNRNRIPVRHLTARKSKNIGDYTHRATRRINIS